MKRLNKVEGFIGENKACAFLEKKKYKIIERNYSNKIGEIDIIAFKEGTTIFIEVKSRSTKEFGLPCEAVDIHKQRKIRLTAQAYLQKNKLLDCPCRFDVIEVLGEQINHIENCF